MKIKRSLFVIALITLFMGCYVIMNRHFDELARYPFELSEHQRKEVLSHLNTEEINYLVSQKIKPQQFLPFINIKGFDLNNTLWYDVAYHTQKPVKKDTDEENKAYIVSFINRYHDQIAFGDLKDLLSNYSYNVLTRFFDEGDAYIENAKLISTPSNEYTMMKGKQTLYTYEPKDLVTVNNLPHASIVKNDNDIVVKKEVVKPLEELCAAAREINQKPSGDMRLVAGYISYEDQITLYEKAKTMYGDQVLNYWDVPGQSEFQLGYSVQLIPNEMKSDLDSSKTDKDKDKDKDKDDTENKDKGKAEKNKDKAPSENEREQEIWLKDNAYKYGFIIRYPKQKERVTGKKYQPYTLRFVGKELAKKIHDNNLALEEVNLKDYKNNER